MCVCVLGAGGLAADPPVLQLSGLWGFFFWSFCSSQGFGILFLGSFRVSASPASHSCGRWGSRWGGKWFHVVSWGRLFRAGWWHLADAWDRFALWGSLGLPCCDFSPVHHPSGSGVSAPSFLFLSVTFQGAVLGVSCYRSGWAIDPGREAARCFPASEHG